MTVCFLWRTFTAMLPRVIAASSNLAQRSRAGSDAEVVRDGCDDRARHKCVVRGAAGPEVLHGAGVSSVRFLGRQVGRLQQGRCEKNNRGAQPDRTAL